ncbi:hypothetical protein [Capnocytophaga bilenii]|uniref:hypothetical protein n=1 Tax=Capnocytophaga bilenii TaxID=2819369 RepID=UPI0028D21761|nr:hypothetical protein [Capnocytophaga bilenii]
MKKYILTFLALGIILVGCNKNEDNTPEKPQPIVPEIQPTQPISVSLQATLDKDFENTLYPSLIYSFAGAKDENGNFIDMDYFQLKVTTNKKFDAKIRITNDKFIRETILDITIPEGESEITNIDPHWKFDDFVKITTAGYTSFKFEIIDVASDKVVANTNLRLSYRSINECVTSFYNDNNVRTTYPLFAAYVNEDAPEIESLLKDISDLLINEPRFLGWISGGNDDYVKRQIIYVISYLAARGYTYSNITNTSNSSTKINSQQVRFVKNTILNKQANCVDGSVLMASIFRKIGFKTGLVIHPGHMYFVIKLPESGDNLYIETTTIQLLKNVSNDYEAAYALLQIMLDTPERDVNETVIVDIDVARSLGIKPIQ